MTPSASLSRTYLLECYKSGLERADVDAILVPEDEVVFHVFAAESAAAVREASVRASVEYERVVESVALGQLELRRKQAEPHQAPSGGSLVRPEMEER